MLKGFEGTWPGWGTSEHKVNTSTDGAIFCVSATNCNERFLIHTLLINWNSKYPEIEAKQLPSNMMHSTFQQLTRGKPLFKNLSKCLGGKQNSFGSLQLYDAHLFGIQTTLKHSHAFCLQEPD